MVKGKIHSTFWDQYQPIWFGSDEIFLCCWEMKGHFTVQLTNTKTLFMNHQGKNFFHENAFEFHFCIEHNSY